MQNITDGEIIGIVESQKSYFKSGRTLSIKFRRQMLQKLHSSIEKYENDLAHALWADLHKSYEEAYLTEFSIIKGEIKSHLKNLSRWSAHKRVPTPIKLFPA